MACSLCTSQGSILAGCPLSDTPSLSFYYVVPQSSNQESYQSWWSTALLHVYTKSASLTLTTDELSSHLTVKGLRPMGDFPGVFSPSLLLPTSTLDPLEKLCKGGVDPTTALPTSPSSSFSFSGMLGGVISSLSQLVVSPSKDLGGTPQKPSPPPSRWLHPQHCGTLLAEVVSLWERHVGATSPLFLLHPPDLPMATSVEGAPCSLPQLLSLHAPHALQTALLSTPSTLRPHTVSFLLPFAVSTHLTLTVSRCPTLPGSPLLLHLRGQGRGQGQGEGGGEPPTTLLILRYLIASRALAAEALERECASLHAKVVHFVGMGMKDVAAAYLQRVQRVRLELKRRQGALGNLEAIKGGLVSQREAKESVEQMREFRDTLAALEVDEEEAEGVMEEVREELRKVEHVNHTLNSPLLPPQTYSTEVMEELDALLGEGLAGGTSAPPATGSSPVAPPIQPLSPSAAAAAAAAAKVPSPSPLKVPIPS